jgi:threonine dehydrogenase-like Zn-dependent dehydrogenase
VYSSMQEMMKAVTITGVKQVEVREYPKPKPGKNEVLVKIMTCALCTVDQRAYTGVTQNHFPSVQGHEGSGVVVEVGEGVRFIKVGDHVLLQRETCGICHFCKEGINQCIGRAEMRKEYAKNAKPGELAKPIAGYESQMAQYLAVRENMLTKISPEVPFERATLTEPISCVIHGINRSRLNMGEIVVIIGAGIMGLIHIQIAKLKGATVIVSETDLDRRKRAEKAGADFVINPVELDVKEFVLEHSYGHHGADVVYNTVAISTVFRQGMDLLAPAGRIVAYSSQHPDNPVPIKMGMVHNREIEIIGTLGSNHEEYYMATQLLERNMINTELLIDHIIPIEKCKDAFEKAIVPGTYRVVLKME